MFIQFGSGGFGNLAKEIFPLCVFFRQLEMDDTELALLSAICLLSGGGTDMTSSELAILLFDLDRTGLERPEMAEQKQEPILEAFKHYVRTRRPTSPLRYDVTKINCIVIVLTAILLFLLFYLL